MLYTIEDILTRFDNKTFAKGAEYARSDSVVDIKPGADGLQARVKGSNGEVYEQKVRWQAERGGVHFHGNCSCPVAHDCKHVVAALLANLQHGRMSNLPARHAQPHPSIPHAVAAWLQRLGHALQGANKLAEAPADDLADADNPYKPVYRLLYVLAPDHAGRHVTLCLCKARMRVTGDVASAVLINEVNFLLATPPAYLRPEDEDLIRLFAAMRSGVTTYGNSAAEPKGKIGAQLLQLLVERNQLLWSNSWSDIGKGLVYPLRVAPRRSAVLIWREEENFLRLGWQFDLEPGSPGASSKSIDYLLPTDPPWYVDNLSCGELSLQASGAIPLRHLQELVAQAPPLPIKDKAAVSHLLLARGLSQLVPLPEQLEQQVREDIKPVPCLMLSSMQPGQKERQTGSRAGDGPWQDFAVLAFDYGGQSVAPDPSLLVLREGPNGIERIARDTEAESEAGAALRELGFSVPAEPNSPLRSLAGAMVLPTQSEWLRFAKEGLPQLLAQGWRVEKLPQYRFDVSEVQDWYADVDEHGGGEGGRAWFELELGVVVNQERVSLLPVLVDLIRKAPQEFDPQALAAHSDEDQLLATLPGGVRVALPWGRIKPILSTLGELYFSDKIGKSVKLSRLDAARLAELGGATQLRWIGGERLRDIGTKLAQFNGIQTVPKPQGLQANLRDYQSEGLAWMQFLREYELGGILADDMGLGKTIQTLAHILAEKEAGRLDRPAMVVAPTSLMSNWQDEATRFAPSLRVLVLQGKERGEHFDEIPAHDLVLTTYALLPRDEEKLREHEYHLLILDESHYIKNHRSKAAQTASLLKARHRLCLSGTPLENNLGELWAQFHFLLPGLLGSEKAFNTDFRVPIEKQGNYQRRQLLTRRIKPFLLRRTKDKVAKELPAKTEMVRSVELAGPQRDLYETVRLAMDKKVRSEISKKGVAKSQIVILEALLKLRQVCCDPRLVKNNLEGKKGVPPSAKLVELMSMIDELLHEGRKILVFSQFTSMLGLIEAELEARGVDYALLTGDTIDRASAVRAFQSGRVPIFLISLKAGGVGLNLTAADTVIHYDPWWNPQAENQATDRAWRIGQDKPVFVYKLIAKGTLEERIQQLQGAKSDLAQAMLSDGQTQQFSIDQDDLQQIFAPLHE